MCMCVSCLSKYRWRELPWSFLLIFVSYVSRICLICVSYLSHIVSYLSHVSHVVILSKYWSTERAALVFSADICLAQPEELACVPKLGWPTSPRQLHYHLFSKCVCLNCKIYLFKIAKYMYLFQIAKYICRKLKN